MYAKTYSNRHPERSEAESNFFVLDPKRRCAPFAPHCVRSSTALRMTQTKKCRAKRGRIYKEVTHNVRTNPAEKFSSTFFKVGWADSQSNNQRTMYALTQIESFWFRFFQKANRFSGRRPESHSAECEIPSSFVKRRRGWISLQSKERGRTLVGGSPLSVKIQFLTPHPSPNGDTFSHWRRLTCTIL